MCDPGPSDAGRRLDTEMPGILLDEAWIQRSGCCACRNHPHILRRPSSDWPGGWGSVCHTRGLKGANPAEIQGPKHCFCLKNKYGDRQEELDHLSYFQFSWPPGVSCKRDAHNTMIFSFLGSRSKNLTPSVLIHSLVHSARFTE